MQRYFMRKRSIKLFLICADTNRVLFGQKVSELFKTLVVFRGNKYFMPAQTGKDVFAFIIKLHYYFSPSKYRLPKSKKVTPDC